MDPFEVEARKRMSWNTEKWETSVPADLVPAVEHLRKRFADAHWGCGRTTQLYCYAILHGKAAHDPANEYASYFLHLQARVGPLLKNRFKDMLNKATPPAIFKGFYDLYLDGLCVEAVDIFKELVKIGRANDRSLAIPYLDWATNHTTYAIRYNVFQIENWIKDVCDKHLLDSSETEAETIFWTRWRAPMLLVMEPSGNMPLETGSCWERNDEETTSRYIHHFVQRYVLTLEDRLKKAAGETAVELAKELRPQGDPRESVDSRENPSTIAASPTPTSKKRSKRLTPVQLKRRAVIFGAIQNNLEGLAYCRILDGRGVEIPFAWRAEGCPNSYVRAYKDAGGTWQKRIQDEKSRYKKKFEQTSSIECEKIIQQIAVTRRTRH